MYGAVSFTSICFCASEAYWPYLLRRAEKHVPELSPPDQLLLNWGETIICCPLCMPISSSREFVIVNVVFSSLLSIIMLVLYIIGALESDAGIEMGLIVASLSYIVFHCVVFDMMIWGYTWYNKLQSTWRDGGIRLKKVDESAYAGSNAYSLLWSDVKLIEHIPQQNRVLNI